MPRQPRMHGSSEATKKAKEDARKAARREKWFKKVDARNAAKEKGHKTFTVDGLRYVTSTGLRKPLSALPLLAASARRIAFERARDKKKASKKPEKAVNKKDGGWIQGAIKKPGALKKQLGVPKDQKIPAARLNAAAKKGGKLGQRARLAKTLRGFKHGGEVTHTRWENKWN